ncbi:MAG: hypothetical protein M0P07_03835 [Candidatus Methanomethylophilaceae archaeon]|nr:hypothetical protein [Candidatus Methanomethylophilaceae archaeon]
MPSTVISKMNTCSKTSKVTVTLREDGDLDVKIVSDCPHIQEYAEKLTKITAEDAVDFSKSKIQDPNIRSSVSAPCLTPNAVFDAAWMELGMLSKSLVKKVENNNLDFIHNE